MPASFNGLASEGVSRRILAGAATGIRAFISAQGAEADDVLDRVGLDGQTIEDSRALLDLATYVNLLEQAARQTGQENFGLLYGRGYKPDMLGLIGEIALAAPTLGCALETLAAWFPFHQQATETRLTRWNGRWQLSYRILDGSIVDRRQDSELTMGMFMNVLRACLGPGWTPEIVFFEHPRPDHWKPHESVFDAEIFWGQPTNAILFRTNALERPMPHANRVRLMRLTAELGALTGSRGAPRFADRIKGEIRRTLALGDVHIDAIAEQAGLHRWTLQRRLAEEGVSFSDLLEDTRRCLARGYIAQRHLPLTEIAYMLGYSEMSAFTRACRKWYGASPRTLRCALPGPFA